MKVPLRTPQWSSRGSINLNQPVRLWNPCEASLPHVFAREISHSWPQPNLHSGRLHTQWVDERLRAAEFASWMLDNFCTLGEQGSCRACEKCQGPLNGSLVCSTKGASTPTQLASEWMAWASIRMGSCKLLPLENLDIVGKSTFSARCLWSSKQQNFTMKEWWMGSCKLLPLENLVSGSFWDMPWDYTFFSLYLAINPTHQWICRAQGVFRHFQMSLCTCWAITW